MAQKNTQGEARRAQILNILKNSRIPIKASALAQSTGVSRQVIVQDIALLKAKEEPIVATPQGYLYIAPSGASIHRSMNKVIYSKHAPADTEKELTIMVDHGLVVLDVGVDHPIYGKIHRELNLKSRMDVKNFMAQLNTTGSNLLASLTGGLHFHTVEVPNEEHYDEACKALGAAGILQQSPQQHS